MRDSPVRWARADGGMVATAFPRATEAGVRILAKNGNAADAAVASALALGVCEPQASGLGGQTMMLIGNEKKIRAIDGSSRAPSLAHIAAIQPFDRGTGYRATTVPSTPATLWYVQQRYGELPWKEVIAPAIEIAEDGYELTELQCRLQKRELDNFLKVDSRSGAHYFLREEKPWTPGDLFKQPDLAKTLKQLSGKGIKEFYTGTIARRIDGDMRENGGLLRFDDLALIPWPIERRPVRGTFRGKTVHSMPPPGAGRTLVLALHMLDAMKTEFATGNSMERFRVLAEVFRGAQLERSDRPFDANFYPQVEQKKMLGRNFARRQVRRILSAVDASLLPVMTTEDELRGETTHLSVIDRHGMAVALTQSIERVYGSKAAAAGLGFLYNNYIMDYEFTKVDHPFYLRPNAAPWATVAPSIITENDRIWMAVGSPGSERIFSSIAQFLIHILDEGMSLEDSMKAPRIHCSLGGKISLEHERFPPDLVPYLEGHGYRVDKLAPFAFYLGAIHAVSRDSDGRFSGVAEIRRDGSAGGI